MGRTRVSRAVVILAILGLFQGCGDSGDSDDSLGWLGIIAGGGMGAIVGGTGTTPPSPSESIPPTIALQSPASCLVNTGSIPVYGVVADNTKVSEVTWTNGSTSGIASLAKRPGQPIYFSASVPLTPGVNLIQISAIDSSGNIATTYVSADYDPEAPVIAIESPTSGPEYATVDGLLTLGGRASDNRGIAKGTWHNVVTNASGSLIGETAWSAVVPLALGGNLLQVTVTDVAGSSSMDTLLVEVDAPVVAWGVNYQSQLGNPGFPGNGSLAPVPVCLREGGKVTTRTIHTAVLKADGTVVTWGRDPGGLVLNPDLPSTVPGLSGVVDIDASSQFTLALLSDGTVRLWKHGDVPTEVSGLAGVRKIAAGSGHYLAILSDGTVREWTNSTPSLQDPGLSRIVAISAGWNHSLALDEDGVVWGWGLLNGNPIVTSAIPVVLGNFPDSTGLGRGGHTIIRAGGTLSAWTGTGMIDIPGVSGVVATDSHNGVSGLAVKDDGTLWNWYHNGVTPVLGLTRVTSVAMGITHTVAGRR